MKRRELVGPAPAAQAPALPARSDSGVRELAIRTNLGRASTRFVGRRRELSELRTLLAERRLVTVVGSPGIGKTRLASELAQLLFDEYRNAGGVWRVDLAEVADGDAACSAVARALGLGATAPGRSASATLGAALGARGRVLIVLDAVEGCAPALARLLVEWREAAPNAEWIVTARTRLGLHDEAGADRAGPIGEAVLELGPLATTAPASGAPDAVWLFVDRVRVARRDMVLDEEAADDTAGIVHRLGGVPLAIELASARARTSSFGQLLAELPPLHEGGPSALDCAIAGSWERLEPWQRAALEQLSVFVGTFDIEAAEAVLDLAGHAPAHSAIEAIAALRERALLGTVGSEPPGRPRLAIDRSVRQYARERLALAERDATLLRHARHYAAVGHVWGERHETSFRGPEALAWIAREADNLFAVHRRLMGRGREETELAIRSTLVLDPLLAGAGPASLRLSLLDASVSAAERERIDREIHVRALEARADAHRSLGQGRPAVADAQCALALASSGGHKQAVGRVLRLLATLALMQGRLAEGRGLAEQACTVDRETGHRREEARALGLLGSVEALEGDLETAWSTFERAIAMHREVGDLRFETVDVGNLAVVAHDSGRLTEARMLCDRAIGLCRDAGNLRLEGEVLGLLASVAHESNRLEEARECYQRALTIHREAGNRRAEGTLLAHYGVLLAEMGDGESARAAYARALSLLRECRDRPNEAFVLGALAALEARERSLESARSALTNAGESLEGTCEPRARAALNLWRGHLELALAREAGTQGDEARAAMLIEAARARFDHGGAADHGEVRRVADVRLARRALGMAIDAVERGDAQPAGDGAHSPPADLPSHSLVVCAHGRWFRAPGGEVVSVARWRPLQRLLERLAERREIAPGEPLPVETLVAAGWPGERMLPKAGATRVYTAIASLRRLGLRGMLVRDERGYLLREDVPISRVSRH
jgi:predicted ATPase